MKSADYNFKDFYGYYQQSEFDKAANVLYQAISKILKNKILLNPLIKLDFSNILQVLAAKEMPAPTPESYRQTVDRAVKFLLANNEGDVRPILN